MIKLIDTDEQYNSCLELLDLLALLQVNNTVVLKVKNDVEDNLSGTHEKCDQCEDYLDECVCYEYEDEDDYDDEDDEDEETKTLDTVEHSEKTPAEPLD